MAQSRRRESSGRRDPKTKGVKQSKYHSVKTEIDGITFPSKAEGRRYVELKRQEKLGQIIGLECQPKYKITHPVTGAHICIYIGDFRYQRDGVETVEDVKGVRRDVYVLKKKLMKVLKGVHVVEVRSVRTGKGRYAWSLDGEIESVP